MSKSNKKVFTAVLAIVAIFVIIAAVVSVRYINYQKNINNNSLNQQNYTHIEQSAAKIERKNENDVVLVDGTVTLPFITGSAEGKEIINGYYSNRLSGLNAYADELFDMAEEAVAERDAEVPYNVNEEFVVKLHTENLVSIFRTYYEYAGGAHGSTVIFGDTFNLKTGAKIALSDIFAADSDYKDIIIENVDRQIQEELASSSLISDYFEDYDLNDLNEDDFYISADGLTVFYQLYTIAPYSGGTKSFTIPFSEFDGIINSGIVSEIANAAADAPND